MATFITGKSSGPLGSTAVNLDASDVAVDEALYPVYLLRPPPSHVVLRSLSLRRSPGVVRAGRTRRKLAY